MFPRRASPSPRSLWHNALRPSAVAHSRPIEAFVLLVMVVFTTELAVMELFAPLFVRLSVVAAALADATLFVIIAALPLWVIFSPMFTGRLRREAAARRELLKTFLTLLGGNFLVELLLMLVLPGLVPGTDLLNIVDAALAALLIAPLLWWLLFRLKRAHLQITLTELVESPTLLYLLLLYVLFLSAMLQELVVTDGSLATSHGAHHLFEATMLMLITAPFLWLFVARPLRRSFLDEQARSRAVYEQVIDAVVMADAGGRITALNPAARTMFGYVEAEVVGQPVSMLFGAAWQNLEPLLRAAAQNDGSGARGAGEMTGRHRYGGNIDMDVSVSRILFGGREDFLLILRDISERKETERALRESDIRFREVYEQSEDALLFIKPRTAEIIEANATTQLVFGYDKVEMRGSGLERLFRGEELSRVRAALQSLRAADVLQIEGLAGVRRDGSPCLVSLRAKTMTLQGVDLTCCTLRDITERLRLEQEARDIQSRLIHANKMTSLGLLVSGVAHEINNPNNFIMANAQILADGWPDIHKVLRDYYQENGDFFLGGIPFSELDDQAPQLLASILDGSRRIDQIVGTLKQTARPNSQVSRGEVDLNGVVNAAVAILQHELARHTEEFLCELQAGLPPVSGSSQQLGQVVINLLMNACQALPDRTHGIRLATGFDPATAMVTIVVADEGCGITEEDGLRIMDPFFTTKLDSGGTGLGLSICRTIVNEHGGHLSFVSVPGKGSTFTVKIPAAASAVEEHSI